MTAAAAVAAAIAYGSGSSATLGPVNPAAYGPVPAGGVVGGSSSTTGMMPGMGAGAGTSDQDKKKKKGGYKVVRFDKPEPPVDPGRIGPGCAADLEPMPDPNEDDGWWW